MALYLGNKKVKLYLDNVLYYVNLFSHSPIVNGVLLKSSDDFILKSLDGLYMTAKREEE